MARAQMTARPVAAPVHKGGMGGWVVAGIVALLLAIGAYVVLAGGGKPYSPPSTTSAPASAPAASGAPAPQMTAPPADPGGPRYP